MLATTLRKCIVQGMVDTHKGMAHEFSWNPLWRCFVRPVSGVGVKLGAENGLRIRLPQAIALQFSQQYAWNEQMGKAFLASRAKVDHKHLLATEAAVLDGHRHWKRGCYVHCLWRDASTAWLKHTFSAVARSPRTIRPGSDQLLPGD